MVLPAQAPGVVDVVAVNDAGSSVVSAGGKITYVAPAAPGISLLSPSSGSILGGTVVSVSGSGLSQVSKVLVGRTSVKFTRVSDSSLSFVSPAHAAGSVSITLGAQYSSSAPASYSYTLPPAPVVSSLSSSSGPVAGAWVTLSGTSLTSVAKVFLGASLVKFKVLSDSSVSAFFAAAPGSYDVTVVTAGGVSTAVKYAVR